VNTATRVGAFGAGLGVAFAAAFGVGRLAEPRMPRDATPTHAESAGHGSAPNGAEPTGSAHGGDHDTSSTASGVAPAGLSASGDGYRLVLNRPTVAASPQARLAFRVLAPGGEPLTAYTTRHEKQLHLILVRRDLSGYQHLHPVLGADGVWSTTADLAQPGQWRVLADFDPAGATEPLVLGTDLAVPGAYSPVELPTDGGSTTVDGYTIRRTGNLSARSANPVAFTVARVDGTAVDLQPYLGADGHLVVLRAGDLAYAHAHPLASASNVGAGAQAMAFTVETPGAGDYRLFLEFNDAGRVHAAAFTAQAHQGDAHGG